MTKRLSDGAIVEAVGQICRLSECGDEVLAGGPSLVATLDVLHPARQEYLKAVNDVRAKTLEGKEIREFLQRHADFEGVQDVAGGVALAVENRDVVNCKRRIRLRHDKGKDFEYLTVARGLTTC